MEASRLSTPTINRNNAPTEIMNAKTMTKALTIERTPRTIKSSDGRMRQVEELGTLLPMARKPAQLDAIGGNERYRIYITETVELTAEDFDEFADGLLLPRAWLAGKGGIGTDGANIGQLCVEVTAPGRPRLYVNPEGSNYARYAARLG